VYYLGFARRGWTEAAQRYAGEIGPQGVRGERWQALGMRLLDLEQVDGDLAAWG
jgi:hypothetical protein